MRPVLALLALALGAALPAAVPAGSIDDVIDRDLGASGAPGLAYAVVIEGEVGTVDARGVVRSGGDQEVTPDTAFLTGSISKSFTALAVMQLVEAGDVDLDTEISRYLDVFTDTSAGSITIRQLLSHTSGYSTLQGHDFTTDSGERDALAHRVERVAQEETPVHAPGTTWEYSNVNYQILGGLIEVVSGQEYQAYVETNILEPIGMEHSFVADGEIHAEMATGHRPWFGTKRPLARNETDRVTAPAGGIIASAGDLARYLQVMMNRQDDVLSAQGKAAMMRPASDVSPFYGFGWFVDSANRTVWHSGSSPGVETLATLVPAEQTGVVVLVNAGSGIGFGETAQLRNDITARAIGLDYAGEGSRWSQKALFLALALMPIVFVLSMIWAWHRRAEIRAKSGAFGLFSLWFPLVTTLGMAGLVFGLLPTLAGTSLSTILLFQPDFGLVLVAAAVTGVLWAVFRLAVAYSGRPAPGPR